jgi:AcrR family transcriptional regulator
VKRSKAETQMERLHQAIRHRQERDKQELKRAILDAAGELFLEQGYEHFSLRKVSERIGYSPTTIYLYFRDKDDLLSTLVDEGFGKFAQRLEDAARGQEDPWERVIELGRAYVTFGLQNRLYYQLMFMQRMDFLVQAPEGSDQPRIASFQILRQAVQQGIDAGVVRPGDAQEYSDVLWALVHGIVALAISMPSYDEARVQRMMEIAWQMEFQGLQQH